METALVPPPGMSSPLASASQSVRLNQITPSDRSANPDGIPSSPLFSQAGGSGNGDVTALRSVFSHFAEQDTARSEGPHQGTRTGAESRSGQLMPGEVTHESTTPAAEELRDDAAHSPAVTEEDARSENRDHPAQQEEHSGKAETREGTHEAAIEEAKQGGGQPVDARVREKIEAATGADLQDVRVYTSEHADAAAQAVSARAFARGRALFFAAGQYQPGSAAGDQLLAHELVHVVQQKSQVTGGQGSTVIPISHPSDAAEQEAERIGEAVAQGKPALATQKENKIATQPGDGERQSPAVATHPESGVEVAKAASRAQPALLRAEPGQQSVTHPVREVAAGPILQRSFWGKVGKFFKDVGKGIKTAASAVGKTVSTVVKMAGSAISNVAGGLWDGVKGLAKGMWNGAGSLIKGIGVGLGGLGSAVGKLFTEGPGAAWDALKGGGRGFWDGLKGAGVAVGRGVRDFGNSTAMGVVNAGVGISEHARDWWAAMGGSRDDPNQQTTRLNGDLFVNGPAPTDVRQGELGDCYVLASLAAIARARPDLIERLITDNGDGTYNVTLYEDQPLPFLVGKRAKVIRVTPDFVQGQTPISTKYAQPVEQGLRGPELWVMLIEKAFAQRHGSYQRIEGGFSSRAMEDMTGKRSQSHLTMLYGGKELAALVREALEHHWPVTTSTSDGRNIADYNSRIIEHNKNNPSNQLPLIVGGHVYAPKSVSGDRIQLQNPWGPDHDLDLSLEDFKKCFLTVDINRI